MLACGGLFVCRRRICVNLAVITIAGVRCGSGAVVIPCSETLSAL